MLRRHKGVPVAIAAAGTLVSMLALGQATTAVAAPTWRTHVCHGTPQASGRTCRRESGRNRPRLVPRPAAAGSGFPQRHHHAALGAYRGIRARHDTHMNVAGNIFVHKGGALILGCNPQSFPCLDDPQPKRPSLASRNRVGGQHHRPRRLGIVVHNTWIGHSVAQIGRRRRPELQAAGACSPPTTAPCTAPRRTTGSAAASSISDLRTCWLGVIRNWTGDSVHIVRNKAADPDAMEIVSNVVHGNLDLLAEHAEGPVRRLARDAEPGRQARLARVQLPPDPA